MPGMPDYADEMVVARTGVETARRGMEYLEDGRVLEVGWNASANVLTGTVEGARPRPYRVLVVFAPASPAPDAAAVLASTCSCPMRSDCKHVAALLFAARRTEPAASSEQGPATPGPAWRAALAPQSRPHANPLGDRAPRELGLQLRVVPAQPASRSADRSTPPGLTARPVALGVRGRWTQGGLTWANLGYSHDAGTAEQRSALRQLPALHAVEFPYAGRDAWLALHRINAPLLWDAIAQVVDAGVPITLDDPGQTTVTVDGHAVEAGFDVARRDEGLVVTVPVTVSGERIDPELLGFLGRPAHGLFAWETDVHDLRARPTRLRLARLATRLDDPILALACQPPVHVPDADVPVFVAEVLPALRAQHPVSSADGTFTVPDPPLPVLDLHVQHLGLARIEATWGWRYALPGDDPARAPRLPLYPGLADHRAGHRAGHRDAGAEQEILDSLEWLITDYPHLGSPTAAGHRLATIGVLAGLPMLAFAETALPRLQGDDRLLVTVTGSPLDYRAAVQPPTITVTATARESSRDWLDLTVAVDVDGQDVPVEDLLRALAADQEVLILPSGTYLRLDQPDLQQLRRLIDEARSLQENARDGLGVSRYHVDLWDELEKLGVVDAQATAWRRTLASLTAGDVQPRDLPDRVDATLRAYQAEGYSWLAHLRELGLGGVLADDMGLGKTVQAIALIADERGPLRRKGRRIAARAPWLVVAPASVVHNWAAEFERFAPSLRVVPIWETSARRGTTLGAKAAGADVVVVSYTLFRLDFAQYQELAWTGLVLDEAQFVKNHQSKAYGCARQLDAPFKLAVTGTPMENNLMELWSLLSITAPGLFPSPKRFAEFYQRPIEREADDERLALLRRRIRPFMLRRTKEEVAADLPPKQEQVLELDLHPRHRRLYDTHLQRERQKVLGLLGNLDANRFQIFQSLTMLRQLSLDAGLVDEKHAAVPSAKLDALLDMLGDVVAEGHRVLVFSQFTRFLALARARLDAAGITYAYLDGRTRNRARAIDSFRDGQAPVFLISLKAGGFGLNLTEADYVVLLDPWWNPATEAQAVDRAHRIGQDKHVMVYRLVSRDTIEEKVMALKAEKAALFAGVMSDAGAGGVGLSADDIRDLLG